MAFSSNEIGFEKHGKRWKNMENVGIMAKSFEIILILSNSRHYFQETILQFTNKTKSNNNQFCKYQQDSKPLTV